MKTRFFLVTVSCLWAVWVSPVQSREIERLDQVEFISTDWADGDSFLVRFENGEEATLRLYAVDCLEKNVYDDSDARRLRAQRRYFGITGYGGSTVTSVDLAKSLGRRAAEQVESWLADPFTVYTAYADGRGDGKYKRIYAFVTLADGRDLAKVLVDEGLARAYGVYRGTPNGLSHDEYRELLKDAELVAARNGKGIWSFTNWEALEGERTDQRTEDRELNLARGIQPLENPMNVNTAARDELMRLPGVGEVTANAIIESRPFVKPDDLLRVRGIGPKTLENIREWVLVE